MKNDLQCVATDDEPVALEILEDYINMVPGLTLVAKCTNAIETMAVLRNNLVDILFIDIQMPGITGVEFVRSLKAPPDVIFTTAYPNYAIDGFELDATDYLLKPIAVDRFLKAVNKVFAKRTASIVRAAEENQVTLHQNFLFVKCDQAWVKVQYAEILFIEGLENYVRIHCNEKAIITLTTMKNIEEMLPAPSFLRIHRSYIVNLQHVDSIQNNVVSIKNKNLLVGKSYKKNVAEILRINSTK